MSLFLTNRAIDSNHRVESKIEPLVFMGQHRFESDPSLKLTVPRARASGDYTRFWSRDRRSGRDWSNR
jgi:hypothetical protein